MHRGEACSIRPSDCDLILGSIIRIYESIVGAKDSVLVKGPKTRASIRNVAIDAKSRKELMGLRQVREAR